MSSGTGPTIVTRSFAILVPISLRFEFSASWIIASISSQTCLPFQRVALKIFSRSAFGSLKITAHFLILLTSVLVLLQVVRSF